MRNSLSIGLIVCAVNVFAQDFPRKEFNLEKLVDEIFPIQDLDLNYQELYENMAQLLSNPLDLNTVTNEQLRALFVVTETEVNSFLKYREENGPLLSVYELQAIPGWSRDTFDNIIPFVTVYDAQSRFNSSILRRMAKEENNYLVVRYERVLENKKGYSPKTDSAQRYSGSPDKLYMRYRVARSNDFSAGFTLEKDPGEAMKWSPSQKQYGFDFNSFHAQIQNKGKLKNLIIGDYQSQFGQGLILGSVFGFGKNSETVTTTRRSNLGFLPYASLNENTFLRGGAISYALHENITIHAFGSHLFKDATLNNPDGENSHISSLSTTGLHRTPTELLTRKKVGEMNIGAVLQFKKQSLDAGLIFHQTDFTPSLLRNQNPYNQFSFNGNQNRNVGVYLNYSWSNFTFFSEAAQTLGHGKALTAGLLGNFSNNLELSLLYRNFAKDFYSFYSNAFSESTSPQNEKGFYWGWKYAFNKKYSASGYMDLFQFPWLRYRGYAPSEGSEWLLRFNYAPSKKMLFFVQIREETKIRNFSDETTLYHYAQGIKRNYWINWDYTASPNLSFKTRAQFSSYDLNGFTRGFALVQDVSFSMDRWSFSFRYALFDTDNYDNRLYVYERDVWLAYSFPAYSGVGLRNYALVQFKLSQKMDVWFRWSHVRYTDRTEIGSGGEALSGNTGNDVKFQVRMRF